MDESAELTINNNSFDISDGVMMCVDCIGTKMGCALLKMSAQCLYCLQQDLVFNSKTYNDEFLKTMHNLNIMFEPTVLYMSTRIDATIKKDMLDIVESQNMNLKIDTVSAAKFNRFATAKAFREMDHTNSKYFTILNNALHSTGSMVTVGAISCLLEKCTSQMQILSNSDAQNAHNLFVSISYLPLNDFSFLLDEETIYSLKLLPSRKTQFQKSIDNGAYSLFEILGAFVTTEMGKCCLKNWILNPLKSLKKIKERSSFIETLLEEKTTNKASIYQLSKLLNKMPNAVHIVASIETGKAKYNTWVQLCKFLELTIDIVNYLRLCFPTKSVDRPYIIETVSKIELDNIKQLLNHITEIIDLPDSIEMRQIVIKRGVNKELDNCKHMYNNLEYVLSEVADKFNKAFASFNSDSALFNVVYVPQLGYLLCSASTNQNLVLNEHTKDTRLEVLFQTETHTYYKNETMDIMDANYGDIYTVVQDMEIEILQDLQNELIKNFKPELVELCQSFSEFEVLVSWTLVSFERNYCKPEFSNEKEIVIKSGRNAINETLVASYIPNDLEINSTNTCGIITGPNMSGKTSYLVSCGLSVLLAHLGCFVPCSKMRLSVVDQILTRIWTRESVIKTQSTFYLDSQQMAKCLSICTSKSLVLIDEFGKGTNVLDGPALFGAVINFLTVAVKPCVLACTHYHELFGPGILGSQLFGVKFYCTQIILSTPTIKPAFEQLSVNQNELITFLYTVKEGISTDSYGILCAEHCGMKKKIVQRAKELSSVMNKGKNIVEYCSKISEEEIKTYEINEKIATRFLEWDLSMDASLSKEKLRAKLQELLRRSSSARSCDTTK